MRHLALFTVIWLSETILSTHFGNMRVLPLLLPSILVDALAPAASPAQVSSYVAQSSLPTQAILVL
jgi:hypothetical protein